MTKVRAYQAEDFPELHRMDQRCFAPGIAYSKAELRYFLSLPASIRLIAEVVSAEVVNAAVANGAVGNFDAPAPSSSAAFAGFAIAEVTEELGSRVGHLITIDVDPEYRRLGIGSALLTGIEEAMRSQAVTGCVLEVAADNLSAQSFYARHGFRQTGRITKYYPGGKDAFRMEKLFQRL